MKRTWKDHFLAESAKLSPEYPKVGRELSSKDLESMQIGTPFYVFSPSAGLKLRTKQEVDGENLLCYNSTGIMRYKLQNCGESFAALEAKLNPLAYQSGLDLFTVISSNNEEPVTTVQSYTSRENAIQACHASAKTCAKMCMSMFSEQEEVQLKMDEDGAKLIDPRGKRYYWRIIEGIVQ